ncbi:MAG: aryldialkylphosphatase [Conexibacter sp.]|nr:aryldialkylphosphatase [Conexibacter sp.]
MIRTVTGDIEPDQLGVTYSHEHLVATPPPWMAAKDPDLVILDLDAAIEEARMFRDAGGRSMFEASAWDYGRDPHALAAIAAATGVQIIATAGFNKGLWFEGRAGDWPIERYEELMVTEVVEGIDGSAVRGGVVKFGSGYNSISAAEERVIRAAARAHRRTGAPLHGHTEAGTMALEQIAILREEGVDLRRVAIAHLTRNVDPWYHRQVADTGVYLCFDQLSKVRYGPESGRIDALIALIEAGHVDQLLVGGDLARRSDLYAYERGPGLRYVLETWIPRLRAELRERGSDEDRVERIVQALLVENPRRYFDFTEPYPCR